MPDGGEIDAGDELQKDIAVWIFQCAGLLGIHVWRGKTELAKQIELIRFLFVGAIDAVRRYFEDGLRSVDQFKPECVADAAAVERYDLRQLRRRAGPVLHDTAEQLPGNITVL